MSEEVTYECASCSNTTTDSTNFTEINEQLYCEHCDTQCSRCDELVGDDYYYICDQSESWCESCAMDHATWCDGCDERYSDRISFYDINDRDISRCEYCASNNYSWCDDHEEYYDDECYKCGYDPRTSIHDYSYKPDPIFIGTDKHDLFFGIEVEAEIWSGDINGASVAAEILTAHHH